MQVQGSGTHITSPPCAHFSHTCEVSCSTCPSRPLTAVAAVMSAALLPASTTALQIRAAQRRGQCGAMMSKARDTSAHISGGLAPLPTAMQRACRDRSTCMCACICGGGGEHCATLLTAQPARAPTVVAGLPPPAACALLPPMPVRAPPPAVPVIVQAAVMQSPCRRAPDAATRPAVPP
jgi:hypothetical protein